MATLARDIEDTTEQDIEAAFGEVFSDEEDYSDDDSEVVAAEVSGSGAVRSESSRKRRKVGENYIESGITRSSSQSSFVDSDEEELQRRTKLAVVELRKKSQEEEVVVIGDEDSDDNEGEEVEILETTASNIVSLPYRNMIENIETKQEGDDNIFETAEVQAAGTTFNFVVVKRSDAYW